ncbi:MAG: alpha/beta fold hydrolase [Actinomycetota bacterium]
MATAFNGFLRPIAWRGKTPRRRDVDGQVIFRKDRRVQSFDGTTIAYTVRGKRGPWVALVPGFSCPDNFWRYLVPELEKRYRVIIWDLRGLGLSGTPYAPGYRATRLSPAHFTIESYVRDLEAILDAERVQKVALLGHSMGGQIILETYRESPKRVWGLAFVTAPYESPLRTFYGRDFTSLFHGLNLTINLVPRPAVLLWRALFAVNTAVPHALAKLGRALGPNAKHEDMAPYYRHMAYLDPLVMLKMAEAMRAHSAADVLPTVKVPALVLAATSDTFTPLDLARRMAKTIPRAELMEIEGAGHGAIIEKPDEVNSAVVDFLKRHAPRARRRAKAASSPRSRGR